MVSGVRCDEIRHIIIKYTDCVKTKRLMRKREIWDGISQSLKSELNISKNPEECLKIYEKVLKKYKEALIYNNTSGNNGIDVPFAKDFEDLTVLDDSIEPEFIISARKCTFYKKAN